MPANCLAGDAGSNGVGGLLDEARSLLRDSSSRLELALQDARRRIRDGSPDWLRRRSGYDPFDGTGRVDDGGATLVVQEDRADGTDLLTIRYVHGDTGSLQTYAGAGLNRTQYFDELADQRPALMNDRPSTQRCGRRRGSGCRVARQRTDCC